MEEGDCPICLEVLHQIVLTACGHRFCYKCIRTLANEKLLTCPLCRAQSHIFSLKAIQNGSEVPLFELPTTIYGLKFFQHGGFGVASYHFENPQECYISYARAPELWILSDGSRPPEKKYFQETSYDNLNRIFRGKIDWGDVHFPGMSPTWDYQMIFSSDWTQIIGGEVHSSDGDLPTPYNSFWGLKYTLHFESKVYPE